MEDVWLYPRPPIWQPVAQTVRIRLGGTDIATTRSAVRVLETSHPPVYYLPPDAFLPGTLTRALGGSFCEWKGMARYWDVAANGQVAHAAGWSYPDPTPAFAALADHIAVYAGRMESCWVGDEQVTPQPGGFYGGWITADLKGPFKGGPGTSGW